MMGLLNLRNALMAGKRLPYDAEVEYLESTGTQYVNTGIAGTNDLALEGDIYLSLSSGFSSNLPFGVKAGPGQDDAQRCLATTYNSEKWIYLQRGAYGYNGRAKVAVSQDGWHYMYLSKSKAVIDNTSETATLPWNVSPENSEPVYIFGFNNNGGTNYAQARCRYFRIYENGVLVRDYIPVRVGTVGYLYDRVSGKLFGNAGTGDFVLGPDVVPVEYIENRSNHAQIIDTGFYANQNTKSLITFEKLGADGWLFGSRNGSYSATDKFGIFAYQSPDGKISAQVGSTYIEPIISGSLTNRKSTIEMSLADGVIVDGKTIAAFPESQKSQTFTSTYPIALFSMRINSSGFNSGIYCRVYAYQIFENGLIARSFRPVRVGTEGAMMDVLTRRIYRNAGTGAFAYGNDLKYPIPSE